MLIIACILAGLHLVAPQCTFPTELSGNWITSTLSTLTFTPSTVQPMFTQAKTLTCYLNNGTRYVVRSPIYSVGPADFRDYACLDLRKESDTKFTYHELTPKNPADNNDRKKIEYDTTDVTEADVCTLSAPDAAGMYSFMMKEGTLSSSVIQNPESVLGVFNVTMAGCDEGATLDVCSNPTRLDFNFSQCASPALSDELIYHALHYMTDDVSNAYITLFIEEENSGGSNPFIPFSCLVVGNSSMTLAPGDCQRDQDDVNVTAPGIGMDITKVGSCTFTTTLAPEPTGTVPPTAGTTTANTAEGTTTADSNSTASSTPPVVGDGSTTTRNRGTAGPSFISVVTLIAGVLIGWTMYC